MQQNRHSLQPQMFATSSPKQDRSGKPVWSESILPRPPECTGEVFAILGSKQTWEQWMGGNLNEAVSKAVTLGLI